MFALPVPRRERYAVAVTVGLESLAQARTHELRVALGFAVPTIVLVTILVHLTVRRLVGQPLNEQTATLAGEAAVRAAQPLSRNGYKVQITKTAVKRAVMRAAGLRTV